MEGVKTTSEALDAALRNLDQIDESNWGPWKLDRQTRHIYIEKPTAYDISVDDLIGDALLLTLRHMEEKTWLDNAGLGAVVRAAFAIMASPGDPLFRK